MKLSNIKLAIAASTLLLATGANAKDGTINFTGTIVTASCEINAYGTNSTTASVDLGTVSTSALSSNGEKAAPTPFTIAVSGCDANVKKVSVQFDGTPNSVNNAILASTGTAKNVGIAISNDNSDTILPLNTASTAIPVTGGAATMPFTARFYAVDQATAGTVNASATFNISYQ